MSTPEMALCKENKDVESLLVSYEYDPWLLDDHPLRSHPTRCIPGLGPFMAEWYISFRKRWKETLLRAACLLLACLAAVYVVRAIPALPSLPSLVSRVPPHHNFRGSQVACSFPHSDPRSNAFAQSVATGCEGFRTDLWLHENDLLIGVFGSGGKVASHLRFHLDSLLKELAPRTSSAGPQIAMNADQMKKNPRQTFILALDAKSRFDEIYPLLVSQLDTLRQRGDLSYWNGTKVIRGPVTVVVTGEPVPSSHCSSYSYADLFWRTSGGDISWDGVMNDSRSPICAV